jgi:hypothetical protein
MRIARRTFLVGAGVVAASPVLANLLTSASDNGTRALPLSAPLLPPADASDQSDLVFKIEGWNVRDALSSDRVPAAVDEAWISVNQSWRTAWR